MGNLVEKRNKMALIEEMINREATGIVSIAQNISFTTTDIYKVKKCLLNKSQEKVGKERQMYYTISIKINEQNYMDYFKVLDTQTIKTNKNSSDNETYENEYELAPRKSQEIIVGKHTLPKPIKDRLSKYIYLFESNPGVVRLYLRNKTDYESNISDLRSIKSLLNSNKIDLKIHIIGGSKIIENMNKYEKKEFVEFLKTY